MGILPGWGLLVSAAAAQAPEIPFEHYELPNGLDVVLVEDHDIPIVQVNVWYHVGSRDEEPGRTGFAHLFEHLMFQGSGHFDDDYFVALERHGGRVNGSTSTDRTNYFEGVPSQWLPLALWLESDRMGWLLDALDQEKLDNQREVVRNERRQRYENQPYGTAMLRLVEALYPEGHPYHHTPIGSHEDLERATLDDVRAFFRTWYVPNNASLVIAGDFDPRIARELVAQTFGPIPRGEDPVRREVPRVTLEEEKVLRVEEPGVPFQKVWIAWHSPPLYEAGDAELDVLSSLLFQGEDALLHRVLVRERQLALDVAGFQWSRPGGSVYVIQATAAPGHTTDELVEAIDAELAGLLEGGVDPHEVEVAVTNWEASFYRGLTTIAAKADTINGYLTFRGDPGYLPQDVARYRAVTADGVAETARTWLGTDARVVLHIHPEEAR